MCYKCQKKIFYKNMRKLFCFWLCYYCCRCWCRSLLSFVPVFFLLQAIAREMEYFESVYDQTIVQVLVQMCVCVFLEHFVDYKSFGFFFHVLFLAFFLSYPHSNVFSVYLCSFTRSWLTSTVSHLII